MSFLESINEDGFFFTFTYYLIKILSYGIIDWFLIGIVVFLIVMFFFILFFQRAYIFHYYKYNFVNIKFFLFDFLSQKKREIKSLFNIYWFIIKKYLNFKNDNKIVLIIFIITGILMIIGIFYLFSTLGPQIAEQRLNATLNNTINSS